MRLAVFSHKTCWSSTESPTGYATDGGFPFQIRALSELFDQTILVVPVTPEAHATGEVPLAGHNLTVRPLSPVTGSALARKAQFPFWTLRNAPALIAEAWRAHAVHAPVPGDVGTLGMLAALAFRKPLMVRYCGNWRAPRTAAQRFWIRTMERIGGGRNVMFATGGDGVAPSRVNPGIDWIFATSLATCDFNATAKTRTSADPVRLIIVCRQQRPKGTARVLHALPVLARTFPQVTLDVVGDGDALDHFRSVAAELGVNDRVTFHGKLGRSGVFELLSRATLFVYPTTSSEGFPKAVLEALAAGLPVVTTCVSVLPHLIGSRCGELLGETGPEAIASAIHRCLDPDRYRQLSANAIEVARRYSLERWRDSIGERLESAWGPLNEKAV